jgi:hypothetical protein
MMAATPGAEDQAARCEFCRYFARHHVDPVAADRARTAGITIDEGRCQRFPAGIPKRLADWCGEFEVRARG